MELSVTILNKYFLYCTYRCGSCISVMDSFHSLMFLRCELDVEYFSSLWWHWCNILWRNNMLWMVTCFSDCIKSKLFIMMTDRVDICNVSFTNKEHVLMKICSLNGCWYLRLLFIMWFYRRKFIKFRLKLSLKVCTGNVI